MVSGKRKQTGGHEFELAEAREPACLEGERWVEIHVEKLPAENHAARKIHDFSHT
jgi:hypothetical protein